MKAGLPQHIFEACRAVKLTGLSLSTGRLPSELQIIILCLFCLIDLILYIPSTVFQLNRDGSSWVEPVLI